MRRGLVLLLTALLLVAPAQAEPPRVLDVAPLLRP